MLIPISRILARFPATRLMVSKNRLMVAAVYVVTGSEYTSRTQELAKEKIPKVHVSQTGLVYLTSKTCQISQSAVSKNENGGEREHKEERRECTLQPGYKIIIMCLHYKSAFIK